MSDAIPPCDSDLVIKRTREALDRMGKKLEPMIGVTTAHYDAGTEILDDLQRQSFKDGYRVGANESKAVDALAMLVTAKHMKDMMETYPNVCGGALNEASYKDLKKRGWALAFQIVEQHKKENGL